MAAKVLYVSSAIQQVLMEQVYKVEFKSGFWAAERPAGHGDVWADVEIKVAGEDDVLGAVNFTVPRNYNFMNLDFYEGKNGSVAAKDRMIKLAQTVKPNATDKHVKAELVELGQIVGGRLTSRTSQAVKINRGNHKPGTLVASVRAARLAGKSLAEVAAATQNSTKTIVAPKKTVVKAKAPDAVEGTGTDATEHLDVGHAAASNGDQNQQAA